MALLRGAAAVARAASRRALSTAAKGPLQRGIETKVVAALGGPEVVRLAVHNDSAPQESHFRVSVVAAAFQGKSLPQRHRMVYAAIQEELACGIHAIQLHTQTPAEADAASSRSP